MSDEFQDRVKTGALNLLVNCGRCKPGQKLLLVHETENDGYYDAALVEEVRSAAAQLGLEAEMYEAPFRRHVVNPDTALLAKMEWADCTVFLARLGDQIRFRPSMKSQNRIISYALDREMMASSFGTLDYRAFEMLKDLINQKIAGAEQIRVTCAAGTDFSGTPEAFSAIDGDVTLKRFPISVFAPVPSIGFRGRIAQDGFLTGTGSNYYSPYACALTETLFIEIAGQRISGFKGNPKDVAAAKAHYKFVGEKYGIDPFFIHSWHAGIHPGCRYPEPAANNFERWSGSAFGNPRLLHFHSCGDYPPGEISLNILDPTVTVDGQTLWERGRLIVNHLPGGDDLKSRYPGLAAAFDDPAQEVGQAECGHLAFALIH